MELQIAGTNMVITAENQQYIEQKLAKLNRHKPDITDIKVEVSEENTKSPEARFLMRITVMSSGRAIHGLERGESVFAAVDKTVDMMARQIEKRKGKLYDRGRGSKLARGKYAPDVQTKVEKKIVKRKHFAIEPMTIEEAIEQMEGLGHNFFLFIDSANDETRILYKRNDGNYGLIEPEFIRSRD
jgi:putative sigma-54 modulation protein